MTPDQDQLAAYRAKRDAESTPEPFGPVSDSEGPRVFVVQKHAARRLHYDLRLEFDGVLRSWAVPQGPCLDPSVKRFAVQTEDHPMEYADFEGVIPQGNYGAGAMIVWDRGRFAPLPVTEKEETEGKLLFELFGHKLRGVWTLFPTNRDKGEWLLLKKEDKWSRSLDAPQPVEASILSGLEVEALGEGSTAVAQVLEEIEALDLPAWELQPNESRPMLAEHRDVAFTDEDWHFELKYDGFRVLATRDHEDPLLHYRSGRDATRLYPDVARALLSLAARSIVLDGEVVVLDADGKPNFQRLQRRANLSRRLDVQRGTLENPATYYAFDVLAVDGWDLRDLPLIERKRLLSQLVPSLGVIRYADGIDQQGEALFAQVSQMGLEGIMAKRRLSLYESGVRSPNWLKIRSDYEEPFLIIGYRPPNGLEQGVGALHVASVREGDPVYAGRVGSGFSEESRKELEAVLEELRVDGFPLPTGRPSSKGDRWVRPVLRCEVRYKEWTEGKNLRHPVYQGLLPPNEIPAYEPAAPVAVAPKPSREVTSPPPKVRLSNLDKPFWPKSPATPDGLTKGDLINYYRAVAPWMLPYLRDRPLVLDRYPDGIDGKSFYQKNAPDHAPDWLRTIEVWSGDPPKAIEYFVCNDEESLLYLANLGAIPFHLWASRVDQIDRPDWSIIDLDPKGAPFENVVTLALAAKQICDELELSCFVKTSGSTGLHILIPLGGTCSYTQSRQLAELLSRVINSRHPKISTLARTLAARQGRVYLDYLQNRRGQLLVAPYSLRPLPGAPASTPLDWSEVDAELTISQFRLETVPKRLKAHGPDPSLEVLTTVPDLAQTLQRLSVIMGSMDS